MLSEALHLADLGYRLIPCVGKSAVLEDWPHRASRDPEVLREWFGNGSRNLAILTGDVGVVDCDSHETARVFYEAFRSRIRSVILTPRGGAHFPFRADGLEIPNAVKTCIEGIECDFRGRSGYVIHPPSVVDGIAYRYVRGMELPAPGKLEPFDPAWLPQQRERRITRGKIKDVLAYIARIPSVQGEHGSAGLIRAISVLRDEGYSEQEALIHIGAWNIQNARPLWSAEEILRATDRVYHHYAQGASQ